MEQRTLFTNHIPWIDIGCVLFIFQIGTVLHGTSATCTFPHRTFALILTMKLWILSYNYELSSPSYYNKWKQITYVDGSESAILRLSCLTVDCCLVAQSPGMVPCLAASVATTLFWESLPKWLMLKDCFWNHCNKRKVIVKCVPEVFGSGWFTNWLPPISNLLYLTTKQLFKKLITKVIGFKAPAQSPLYKKKCINQFFRNITIVS